MTTTTVKSTKKNLVKQCLTELGVNASFGSAKKWFQKNHKLSLADATFYHVRKIMQQEKLQLTKPLMVATAKALQAVSSELHTELQLNVVDVVKNVKELIDKLGKDEAKKLIDLL